MNNTKYDFTNDVIFKAVLKRNPNICKEIIERCIPGITLGEFEYVESEEEVIISNDVRKFRFDILAKNDTSFYNLEMMRYNDSIEKLTRKSLAMIDADQRIGSQRKDLLDSTCICLCTYDPFGLALPQYTIHSYIDEAKDYLYKDGREIIIITSEGLDLAREELKPIIQLLNHAPGNDKFSVSISKEVEKVLDSPRTQEIIMRMEDYEEFIKSEAAKNAISVERERLLMLIDELEKDGKIPADRLKEYLGKDLESK